jgi:hypothetical protein
LRMTPSVTHGIKCYSTLDSFFVLCSAPRREGGTNECGNGYDGGRVSGFAELKRVEAPSLPFSERHGGFSETELCFSDEQAKQETHRCLQCDLEIYLTQEIRSE